MNNSIKWFIAFLFVGAIVMTIASWIVIFSGG
jgi:hypothetical protein